MKKLFLISILLVNLCQIFSQTSIRGTITSDTILKANKSPYLVSTQVIISQKGKLTIEPGVVIVFSNNAFFEVQGTLIANGNVTDSISFLSANESKKGWGGIYIKNSVGGNATFNFCKFLYATSAINEECCWGGIDKVSNSRFSMNETAVAGYTGNAMAVNNCLFTKNTYCFTQADKKIDKCRFINNDYGLYQTERIDVSNSEFKNNTKIALLGGRGTLTDCRIENNNTGIQGYYEGFTINNCTISNNTIGLVLSDYNGTISPVNNSSICNNNSYNIVNSSSFNAVVYGNCFCNDDSAFVEGKVFDGLDNSAYGLIDYSLLADNCNKPRLKTMKPSHSVYYYPVAMITDNNNDLLIYPNPASKNLTIECEKPIERIEIVDNVGKPVFTSNYFGYKKITVDVSAFKNGSYFLTVYGKNKNFGTYKIAVAKKEV
jgi:hypothetical protein